MEKAPENIGSCGPFQEALEDLLDGTLDEEKSREVRAHVAGCADCAERLRRLSALDSMLKATKAPVPAVDWKDFNSKLRTRLVAEKKRPLRFQAFWLAAAAAVLLAGFLALRAWSPWSGPAPVREPVKMARPPSPVPLAHADTAMPEWVIAPRPDPRSEGAVMLVAGEARSDGFRRPEPGESFVIIW